MTRGRRFQPTVWDDANLLETRLALSHLATPDMTVPGLHATGHHHVVVTHAVKHHAKAAHHAQAGLPGSGPSTQSTATLPIVVIPVSTPPASAPVSTPPASSSPPATTTTTTTGTLPVPTVSGVESAIEQEIVTLVNQQRQQNGLAPLSVDSRLVEAAQIHSADMAQLNQMEHTLPGAALPALQDRAQYVGYNYTLLGENIAFNFPDANSVMNAWMNSPGHRANILNPGFTQIGVGVAYDSQGEPYYTQEFGNPA